MNRCDNLEIDGIRVCLNSDGAFDIVMEWNGSIGFGELSFGIINHPNGQRSFYMDDEHMSKEFVMLIFEKLYEKCKTGELKNDA